MADLLESDRAQNSSPKIIDAGVDWITVFQAGRLPQHRLRDIGQELVAEAASLGNDVSSFSSHGFNGYRAGGCSYGTRYDGYMVTLTGSDARERWLDVMQHASNVSRLDVQTTLEYQSRQTDLIKRTYSRVRRAKFKRGRRPEFSILDNTRSGSTMYFGAKSSDVRGRLYDKGSESKTAPPERIMRLELQYRREPAKVRAHQLMQDGYQASKAIGLVSQEFNARAITLIHSKTPVLELSSILNRTTNARRLAYLSTVGKVMVSKVLETYTRAEVLEALGLEGCHCDD